MEIPCLIPVSGTSKNDVQITLEKICNGSIEQEGNFKFHQMYSVNVKSHQFRGFAIFPQNQTNAEILVQETNTKSPRVWFIFNGMGSQWAGMGKSLMKFQACKESLEKSAQTLNTKNLDLLDILINGKDETFENVLNSFVSIAAVQIALVDLLSELKIKPDGIIGHSVGELGAAYADNCLTAEQVILTAHARGRAILEMGPGDGAMAALGLSWEEAIKKCPTGIYAACHNSKDSVTVSGPAKLIDDFVAQLQTEGIFARKVNSSNQAFHSKYIEPAKLKFKESLDKIIPIPKPRSNRWISSSFPESQWNSDLAKTSSSEYHVNNLISPVLFQEALEKVSTSSVVIEIGPHCLLLSILKRSLPNCSHIGLLNRNQKDNSIFLYQSIGKMFNCGLNPDFGTFFADTKLILSKHKKLANTTSSDAFEDTATEKPAASKSSRKSVSLDEFERKQMWLLSIAQVLGMEIADLEENSEQDFESLGMDSFMCTEIKQMVEIKSGCVFSEAELQKLSFCQLTCILDEKSSCFQKNMSKTRLNSLEQNGSERKRQSKIVQRLTSSHEPKKRNAKEMLNKFVQKLQVSLAYVVLLAFSLFVLCIFAPVGSIFRLCAQVYLWIFYDTNQTKLMTGLLEEPFCAAYANTAHVLKFSGVPDRANFVEILQSRMNSLRTETKTKISFQANLSNGAEAGFDESIERLGWGVEKHWLFMCWTRDPEFHVDRHVIMEETSSLIWDGEMTRLAQHYHNLKWDQTYPKSRPWWEIRIVYSKQLEEFILCFVWNHAYGDGRSFVNLVQSWMADEYTHKSEHESQPPTVDHPYRSTTNPAQVPFCSRKLELVQLGLVKTLEMVCLFHSAVLALSKNALDCWGKGRRGFPVAKLGGCSTFSVGQVRLSRLKSIKDPETGRPFNLNAVVLYMIANAIERITQDSRKNSQQISPSRPFLVHVSWSPFDNKNGHLFVGNNMVGTFQPVPSRRPTAYQIRDNMDNKTVVNFVSEDIENLQLVQKSLFISGERGSLTLNKLFIRSLSLYPYPVSFALIFSICNPSNFVHSNILAPFPTNMTCFQGHRLKDIYMFAMPLPMMVMAVSNSFSDSLNVSLSLSESILKDISPEFDHRFFEYFNQEIDQLAKP